MTSVCLDERYRSGRARKRLYADSSRAAEKIKKVRPGHLRSKNIKNGLAHAILSRTQRA
jgi:hypothetical protein